MCSGPKKKVTSSGVFMEVDAQKERGDGLYNNFSLLLELCATDDLAGFKHAIEEEGHDVNESSFWYGRRIGSKKMGFEERTPLLIASMFGSVGVLNFILQTGLVDVNQAYGSDGATALHCAAAGGSRSSIEIVKLLIGSSADINCVDAVGNRPCAVIPPSLTSSSKSRRKALEVILKGECPDDQACIISDPELGLEEVSMSQKPEVQVLASVASNDGNGTEKKEYPVDPSLPDIKNGIYSTDEFRMYTFKVKPCSRAYSHDWTECPFVHPGENARRRDPRKYHYSCVPCPEFRKGTCNKGDACEYAHGIFECWLHPAQYRTRLCKDETNCSRRVCFFAHKPEELRPLYASTGSGVPSPRSMSSVAPPFDMASSLSPLGLGSPSVLMPNTSTPPMTPTSSSSSMGGTLWQNQLNVITPPTLQLPGSRLKTSFNARDIGLQADLRGLENQIRKQKLLEELAVLSSPSNWNSGSFSSCGAMGTLGSLKPSNLDKIFGSSLDPTLMSQSPTGMQIHQNMSQPTCANYSSALSSSPTRGSSSYLGLDPSAVPNSRLAAFAKRSHSFIDRGGIVNRLSGLSSPASPTAMVSPTVMASAHHLSDWGSPDGKLDWGIQGEELNKLRKSASFGFHNSGSNGKAVTYSLPTEGSEPNLSWVQSIVKDAPMGKSAELGFDDEPKQRRQYRLNSGGSEMIPSWAEQLYMEQEQTVA